MGKPLMIQPADEEKIESLKERLGTRTKVDVVRAGLALLEIEVDRRDRINRWRKAAHLVARESSVVGKDFRAHSRIKK